MQIKAFRWNDGTDTEPGSLDVQIAASSFEEAMQHLAIFGSFGVAEAPKPVERKVTPAREDAPAPAPVAAPKASRVAKVAPVVAAPVAPTNGGVNAPAELVAATTFRQVMVWMLEQGITEVDPIVAKCEELRDSVPVISRLSGDLSERVGRALTVLTGEAAS